MKKVNQDGEKQSYITKTKNFIKTWIPLLIPIFIACIQVYISIEQFYLSKAQLKISTHQNTIAYKQSEIISTQLKMMNQQNKISLFEKRYDLFKKFFHFYSNLETLCSEDYIVSKKRLESQKVVIDDNPNRYMLADLITSGDFTKRQEVINDKSNLLLIDYSLEISSVFEQISFLFELSDIERHLTYKIITIIFELERKISRSEDVKIQSELVSIKRIIENGLLKSLESQLYVTNYDKLKDE